MGRKGNNKKNSVMCNHKVKDEFLTPLTLWWYALTDFKYLEWLPSIQTIA